MSKLSDLERELTEVLNRHSAENELAQYLLGCLAAWNTGTGCLAAWNMRTRRCDAWYGRRALPLADELGER